MIRRFGPLALVAFLLTASAPAQAARRFAVIVGHNDGGPGTQALFYADDDARRMHEVLIRLGGVAPEDAWLLLDPPAAKVLAALAEVDRRAAVAGEPAELFLYYSGHARDEALRLGRTALPIAGLRGRLAEAVPDVRIAVLDSCRSGAVNRTKGARRAPAFEVHTGASPARGTVLLTSSSADEDAQESDHLGGSYFTHHLLSGLMGAADRSGDGRVTLAEAYAHAYERTVADTADTLAGPQHPTFAYDLAGNGDVVLTDPGRHREGVVLPAAAPAGAYFLVDEDGRVAAEVAKPAGKAVRVSLTPGRYRVRRRLPDRLRVGELTVRKGGQAVLDEGRLADAPYSDDPVKGVGRRGPATPLAVSLTAGTQRFFAGPELFPAAPLLGLEVEIPGVFGPGWLLGLDLAVGGAEERLAVPGLDPVPYAYRQLGGGASLLRRWAFGPVVAAAGPRLALVAMQRAFEPGSGLPDQSFSTLTPGLAGAARLGLGAGLSAGLRGRVHYLHYSVDADRSLGYWELGLVLGYAP